MVQRASNKDGRHPAYAHVQLLISKEQFMNWYVPSVKQFILRFPGVRWSVDRINPDGHYELSNMRIIDLAQNVGAARYHKQDRMTAPSHKVPLFTFGSGAVFPSTGNLPPNRPLPSGTLADYQDRDLSRS
jgi:hypothetical protein